MRICDHCFKIKAGDKKSRQNSCDILSHLRNWRDCLVPRCFAGAIGVVGQGGFGHQELWQDDIGRTLYQTPEHHSLVSPRWSREAVGPTPQIRTSGRRLSTRRQQAKRSTQAGS